jgi:hypothetical protein
MESFSADWLALREPDDHAARDAGLTARTADWLKGLGRSVRAIDLASGAGSNVRYLLPRLPQVSHWTLVDYDPALLAVARRSLQPMAEAAKVTLDTQVIDLRQIEALPLDGYDLLTTAAFLDLVSADWIDRWAACCARQAVPVLAVLSYDGRMQLVPGDSMDDEVRTLVNRHQQTDKGFGPALGPDAAGYAARALQVRPDDFPASDWVLSSASAELQRQLVAGWAGAACEMAPARHDAIRAWEARRRMQADQGTLRVIVGHRDLFAMPGRDGGPRA